MNATQNTKRVRDIKEVVSEEPTYKLVCKEEGEVDEEEEEEDDDDDDDDEEEEEEEEDYTHQDERFEENMKNEVTRKIEIALAVQEFEQSNIKTIEANHILECITHKMGLEQTNLNTVLEKRTNDQFMLQQSQRLFEESKEKVGESLQLLNHPDFLVQDSYAQTMLKYESALLVQTKAFADVCEAEEFLEETHQKISKELQRCKKTQTKLWLAETELDDALVKQAKAQSRLLAAATVQFVQY